jgi:hypothetical protein
MAFEAYDLLVSLGSAHDLAGTALERAQHAGRMAELREEREAGEKHTRALEDAEWLALANRAAGDPLGQIQRAQADLSDWQEKVSDLRDQLRKAETRLESARSNVQFWADRAMIVEESTRSRALDPVELASARAAEAARALHEGRMTVERARRNQRQQERRGLARRSASMPTSVLTAESAPAGHLSFRGGGEIVGVS